MRSKELVNILREKNSVIRGRLLDFEAALDLTTGSSYHQCRRAISDLRDLCWVLGNETRHQFWQEETALYPAVESQLPGRRWLVGELRQEHDVFRRSLEDFRYELDYFNLSGQLRNVLRLGGDLTSILRRCLDRADDELHPIVLNELTGGNLPELSFVGS